MPLFIMAFISEFIIDTPGYPTSGSNVYFNPSLAGNKTKVFREGYYQYEQLGQGYVIKPGTGTIFFTPAFTTGERIRIQTT